MGVAQKFIDRGAARIVGVPKTIDNDLAATEYTVGFQSAVEVVVEAIERLHTTAEQHDRIIVVEVMGRYAGWIALTAGARRWRAHRADPRDRVRPEPRDRGIPSPPRPRQQLLDRRRRRGRASVKGGRYSIEAPGDATRRRGSAARRQKLAELIAAETEYEVRATVLGYVQRGAEPCAFDRELATRFGVKAVEMIAEGKFGACRRDRARPRRREADRQGGRRSSRCRSRGRARADRAQRWASTSAHRSDQTDLINAGDMSWRGWLCMVSPLSQVHGARRSANWQI